MPWHARQLSVIGPCQHKNFSRILFASLLRGEVKVLCPVCHSDSARRSRRHGAKDYVVGVASLRPWRCRDCDARFYAWSTPIGYVGYVHCVKCGNLDVQRISSEHGMGMLAWIFRLFRAPAYRCAPCRNRFFSFRLYRRIVPAPQPVQPAPESHPAIH